MVMRSNLIDSVPRESKIHSILLNLCNKDKVQGIFHAFLGLVLLTGCASSNPDAQLPILNPPLSAQEKNIVANCEYQINKILSGEAEVKNPIYSAYERTSLMENCLESQGIANERIKDIFSILETVY